MSTTAVRPVSVEADFRLAEVKRAMARGRSQNRLHTQKALMEYLLLGRVED